MLEDVARFAPARSSSNSSFSLSRPLPVWSFRRGEDARASPSQLSASGARHNVPQDRISVSRPTSILAEFPVTLDSKSTGAGVEVRGEGCARLRAPRRSSRGQTLTFTLSLLYATLLLFGSRVNDRRKRKGILTMRKPSFYINLLFIDDSNLLFFSRNDSTLNSIHNSTIRNLSTPSRRLNPLSLPPSLPSTLSP